MGSKLMLIDEDTTATNFMIRDVRMQVCDRQIAKCPLMRGGIVQEIHSKNIR